MATKITVVGGAVSLNAKLQNRVLKAAAPKIANKLAVKLGHTSQIHYKNAINQVGAFLMEGTGDNRIGGTKRIHVRSAEGKGTSIGTGTWDALSPGYVAKSPSSSRYWRKRGWLASRYASRVSPMDAYVKAIVTGTYLQGKTTRANITLGFSELPDPMDSYVRRSFVLGITGQRVGFIGRVKAGRLDSQSSNKTLGIPSRHRGTLGTYVYVESRRPAISLITSTLGRNLRKVLR